ncbi:E3 ubiquitin-protein ligase WAV3-like [Humulus lupulus]|uniref:E3 ubiquitin-protein ligase WAV3-like n=1 Tax=Humulus lupulus TaxID=3486 RepID=UPI002B413FB6|nr:E3 ubiquitin-protein ligase WAV3-like [Humulus lupulus]
MSFNDDEPIVAIQDGSEEKPTVFVAGKTKLSIINQTEAPLEETKFKVMLELVGAGLGGSNRSGVDLVTILDVSGSMKDDKLKKMKIAMQFIVKKLSPIDRLSIVTFEATSKRLCPLRQMKEETQPQMENIVDALVASGGTNITDGLQTGLRVISDRTLTTGRVAGIILMSDGEQNVGGDAAQVKIGNVPVYTFGFGANHEPKVLKAIAENSTGGTFSDVQNQDNLSIAFSQCLAGLLTVVAQDLKLTVAKSEENESTIEKVHAGNYPQTKDDEDGSVTVLFGDLYDKELRRVIVDLVLPTVDKRKGADILKIDYNYKTGGRPFVANPIVVTITRSGTSAAAEKEEVTMEENRLRTAKMIKEARFMADENKLDEAKDKLVDAQNMLDDVEVDETSPNSSLIEMLRSELQQLLRLMKSQQMYEQQGRPFALSSETSHDRQRFASRGDVEKMRLFATPRMDAYLEQAKTFVEDPSKPLPTVDDDVKQEIAANPLAPIIGALSYYIQSAIQSLQAIDNIINTSR